MDIREETRVATRLLGSLRRGEIDRREFLQLTALLSGAAVMAACGFGSTPKGTAVVPLTTTEADPSSQKFYAAAIAAFEKDHKDIKVQIRYTDETVSNQLFETAVRTKQDLGIMAVGTQVLPGYYARHLLLPVTDLVNTIGKDDFLPQSRLIFDGNDYGIPYQMNAYPLFYRKDLFQQIGASAPQTYQDLLGATAELNGRNGIIGTASSVTSGASFGEITGASFIYQSGWDYFSHDGQLTADNPEVFAGVKRLTDWLRHTDPSMINAPPATITTAYIAGRAASIFFGGRLGVNLFAGNPKIDDVTDVVGIPAGPILTGQVVYGNVAYYTIFGPAKFPAECKLFLGSITTKDNALAWSLTAPGHLLPPLKSVQASAVDLSNPLVAASPYMVKNVGRVAKILKLNNTMANPVNFMGAVNNHQYAGASANLCPWSSAIWGVTPNIDANAYQQILLKNVDYQKAWTAATVQMKQAADQYKAQNPNWKPAA